MHNHVAATRQIGHSQPGDNGHEVDIGGLSNNRAAERADRRGAGRSVETNDGGADAIQLDHHPEEVEGGQSVNLQEMLKHVIGAPIVPKNRDTPPPVGPPPKRDFYPEGGGIIGAPIVPRNRDLPPPGPPPKKDWYPGK